MKKTHLLEGEDLRGRADHAVLLSLHLVDQDVILARRVHDERLRVRTPSDAAAVVKLYVDAQRLVLLLVEVSDVP